MLFLSIYKTAEKTVPPTAEEMAAMIQLVEESKRKGELVATVGCLPSVTGARVRRSKDSYRVTDGPFTEAKEVVAGLAILEVSSKEEAIEATKRFLAVAGEGECELRQIMNAPSDFEAIALEKERSA